MASNTQEPRFRIALVGATGIAGQQFLPGLENHPWFELKRMAASKRSAGKTYREAITDTSTGAIQWYADTPCPEAFLDLKVELAQELILDDIDIVFTAIETEPARELEPLYAKRVPVVSTASAFRYEPDVPIFLPGINPDHAALIERQQKNRGFKGFITPGPNCTTVGLAISLKPLYDAFGVNAVLMTSMQAISGGGRSPGVRSYDILDNVIPYIPKEEGKVELETQKILGSLTGQNINPAPFHVSSTCTRVNVIDAHLESVNVSLGKKVPLDEVKDVWRNSYEALRALNLPSGPPEMIHVTEDPFRPQPRLDRNLNNGMTTVIGRLRKDHILENGIKYMLLSHNTKMGAGMGAILTAEYLIKSGVIN